jgi:hypothetical protein
MVTLFTNTLKALYYKHVMGSSTQQFIKVVVVAKRIEQGIKSWRISMPTEKKNIDHIEGHYRGKPNHF